MTPAFAAHPLSLNAHGNPLLGFHKTLSAFPKKGFRLQCSGFGIQDFSLKMLWKAYFKCFAKL